MKTSLYVGSFDPVTYGHMDIIRRAANMFDHVTVAVGDNPAKKYMFNFAKRVELLKSAIALISSRNISIEESPIKTLTADYARMHGYDVVIKGARTSQDFDYEKLIHEVGATQQRNLETVLLFSSANLGHVSSSAAKELAKYHGLIHNYVPIHVKAAIEHAQGQRIVGITGTVGSGKSTYAKRLNGTHVNMDAVVHELLESDLPIAIEMRNTVKAHFGTTDRKELGNIVFNSTEALKKLNDIYREPVLTLTREKLAGLTGTIILEGALLVEADWLFLCNNRIVLMKTPSTTEHYARLLKRNYDPQQIERRLASQYTYEEKLNKIAEQLNKDQYGKCVVVDTEASENEQYKKLLEVLAFVHGEE